MDQNNTSRIIKTREIFLYSNDDGINNETFVNFNFNLRTLLAINNDRITIHLSSVGGDYHAGIAIYDAIAQCNVPITFFCHGICSSMASLIPQACNIQKYYRGIPSKIFTMPHTDWLIHEGEASFFGTHKQCKSVQELNNRTTESILEIYAKSLYHSEYNKSHKGCIDTCKNFISDKLMTTEDWWITASYAVYYGFAHEMFTGFTEDNPCT